MPLESKTKCLVPFTRKYIFLDAGTFNHISPSFFIEILYNDDDNEACLISVHSLLVPPYFLIIVLSNLQEPFTSNFEDGLVSPIPTLPSIIRLPSEIS